MRETVAVNNIYRWAARFIVALSSLGASAARGIRKPDESLIDTEVA
jgi:hypothetical protein